MANITRNGTYDASWTVAAIIGCTVIGAGVGLCTGDRYASIGGAAVGLLTGLFATDRIQDLDINGQVPGGGQFGAHFQFR